MLKSLKWYAYKHAIQFNKPNQTKNLETIKMQVYKPNLSVKQFIPYNEILSMIFWFVWQRFVNQIYSVNIDWPRNIKLSSSWQNVLIKIKLVLTASSHTVSDNSVILSSSDITRKMKLIIISKSIQKPRMTLLFNSVDFIQIWYIFRLIELLICFLS